MMQRSISAHHVQASYIFRPHRHTRPATQIFIMPDEKRTFFKIILEKKKRILFVFFSKLFLKKPENFDRIQIFAKKILFLFFIKICLVYEISIYKGVTAKKIKIKINCNRFEQLSKFQQSFNVFRLKFVLRHLCFFMWFLFCTFVLFTGSFMRNA